MSEKKFILKVGKRGEIYTTASFRKITGIEANSKVLAIVTEDKVILKPKPSAIKLLRKPDIAPPISPKEIAENREEVLKWLERR